VNVIAHEVGFILKINDMKQKKCRKCKENIKNYEIKRTPIKRNQKPINSTSKTNKNTPARFTPKTKEEILARDKVCIISWKPITDYHHVFHWANANRWPNRNNTNQGVWLSAEIHRIIHHPSPKETALAKLYRAKCIEYLLTLK